MILSAFLYLIFLIRFLRFRGHGKKPPMQTVKDLGCVTKQKKRCSLVGGGSGAEGKRWWSAVGRQRG